MRKGYLLGTLLITLISGIALTLYLTGGSKKSFYGPVSAGGGNTDDPKARNEWMIQRLADPETGRIPPGIRRQEMEFAKTLPTDANVKSLNWLARGPNNIGGRSRALAYDLNNEQRLIAGGVTGGVWLSENGGQNWRRVTGPMHFPAVSCIVQDSRSGKNHIWYYGTGEVRGGYISSQFYYGNGLYKSTDNGESWFPLESTNSNTPQSADSDWDFVSRVVVDPSEDSLDVVLASTFGGIYRSEDGGISWVKNLGLQSPSPYYTELAVTSQGVFYATLDSDAGNKGIWRSENGINWVNITPWDTFPLVWERLCIGINPVNENEVYFIGKTPGHGQLTHAFFGYEEWNSFWKYTYLSGDGSQAGGNWENLSSNIPVSGTAFDRFYTQWNYNLMITVSPHNPQVILIGATNLYRSTDGFSTPNNTTQIGGYWVGSHLPAGNWGSYPNHHPDQHFALFLPSDSNIILSANDGGLYRTSNGLDPVVVWQRMNNGFNTTQVYTVGFDRTATDHVLVAGFQDNANYLVNSSDTMAEWVMPLNGDGSYMGITPGKEFYYLSINQGKVYKMQLDVNGNVL
jgi:hypothetical protein